MSQGNMNRKFCQNIEMERENLGLSQKQMAEKLGLSLSTYKRIITGETEKIDLRVAHRLYKLTGKLSYEFTDESDPHLDLKRKISGLSESQLSFIEGMVDFEKAFASSHADFDDYVSVFIPTGNMEDGMLYDSANIEKVNIAPYRKRYGSAISCGIRITSNHLHPVYNRDDILLISRRPIRDGDTGIFINRDNGRAYIRKFRQTSPCRLEPINDMGTVFIVDDSNKEDMNRWIKFGIVISKIR